MSHAARHLACLAVAVMALMGLESSAFAFKPVGHDAIEALAYRHLLQMPEMPVCESRSDSVDRVDGKEVLRLLIAVGALERPKCFDVQAHSYEGMTCGTDDGRGAWPVLRSGALDDLFARQLGGSGQCFHFMAETTDVTGTEVDPELGVARGLAVDAYQRCTGVVNDLWLELLAKPDGSRGTDRGLYALIHAITDSFSDAHVERDERGRIVYLRPWDLLSAGYLLSAQGGYFGTQRQHQIDDERDEGWRSGERSAECPGSDDPLVLAQSDHCFSPRGLRAADAVQDLLEVTYCAFRQRAIPRLWIAGHGPSGQVTPQVRHQWSRFVHMYLASSRVAATDLPKQDSPEIHLSAHPERTPELLLGAYGRLGGERFERSGDVGGTIQAFPPLRGSYPFVPLAGISGGVRWNDGAREAGFGVTVLSAMLPLSEHLALGIAPATFETYWNTDTATPKVELLSSLRADVFLDSGLWLSFEPPRRAWIAQRFRRDWGLTVGYAWDVDAVASLGESGWRNAGADWNVPPIRDAAGDPYASEPQVPAVVIGSFGLRPDTRAGDYALRVVFPEVLIPVRPTHDMLDAGIAVNVTTVHDAIGTITSIGAAPELRFYPWAQRWIGIGVSPLEVAAGAERDHPATVWLLSSYAHGFLRIKTIELAADVPVVHWTTDRFERFTPWFLRFGWVQEL